MINLKINELTKIITGIVPFSSDVGEVEISNPNRGLFVDCTFGGWLFQTLNFQTQK